jgi:O-acetyl-ADP-ribose deacetylase (regulator of RNase III)
MLSTGDPKTFTRERVFIDIPSWRLPMDDNPDSGSAVTPESDVRTVGPFQIVQGDIAQAETDAIVNAWNRNFIPHWLLIPQGVAGSLRRAAGSEPFREVSGKGMLELGEAVATGAGELEVDYIIHAAALHWYWSSSEEAVAAAAQNVFACAEGLGVDSISIPLLGAGTGRVDPEASLALIRKAWQEDGQQIETEVWVFDEALAERLGGGGAS